MPRIPTRLRCSARAASQVAFTMLRSGIVDLSRTASNTMWGVLLPVVPSSPPPSQARGLQSPGNSVRAPRSFSATSPSIRSRSVLLMIEGRILMRRKLSISVNDRSVVRDCRLWSDATDDAQFLHIVSICAGRLAQDVIDGSITQPSARRTERRRGQRCCHEVERRAPSPARGGVALHLQ